MVLKYIRYATSQGIDAVRFCLCHTGHDELASGVDSSALVSAGFVRFTGCDDGVIVKCFGKSESLKLDSISADSQFVEAFMRAGESHFENMGIE